jgi:hypothetical protein
MLETPSYSEAKSNLKTDTTQCKAILLQCWDQSQHHPKQLNLIAEKINSMDAKPTCRKRYIGTITGVPVHKIRNEKTVKN